MSISRRTFLGVGAAAATSSVLSRQGLAMPSFGVTDRASARVSAGRPVIIASANGIRGVARAYEMISQQSADPLDAAIAGVNIQELDPDDHSVGLGGLPNEDGVVQLDASVMHGPTRRAGAVGALEDIATPSLVAKAVMDYTDHIFLVGAGAKKFAIEMGFKEQNLLTDYSRQAWLRWKANLNPDDNWLDHPGNVKIAEPVPYTHGTINMNAVDAKGDIGSVTTTSGLSWKIPGRVGDSSIIGAGQYCDNAVGAAGSTGRGEANIKICGAFLAIELVRQGKDPEAALMTVLERAVAMTEARLLDERGRPKFDLDYYIVTKDGRYAGATVYEGSQFAVADPRGARLEHSAFMFKATERPRSPGV
jgi:N4-(beta-N-acetylglucosaminyl)-L-asparaginase